MCIISADENDFSTLIVHGDVLPGIENGWKVE
jgi:hypothetical protein